ncbi:serine palmitoyltransferase component [Datura stramonium]|uniref:Serine palmitoyltransferase component n=1 Tax=Datura stramonium TaxID=4076 RepID=A0ABS8SF93_DATST|nr:serine palmitoyltransferase component [Datura stramonium]
MDCSSPSASLCDFFRKIFDWWHASNLQGYAPICLGLEDFYIRRLYLRIQDCFGRPICSPPDAWFDVVERVSNDNNKTLKRTTQFQVPVLMEVPQASIWN